MYVDQGISRVVPRTPSYVGVDIRKTFHPSVGVV